MTPSDLARLTRTCHDILARNPAALTAARAADQTDTPAVERATDTQQAGATAADTQPAPAAADAEQVA